jgi:two-component system chemotaxis sensor kinase CheA
VAAEEATPVLLFRDCAGARRAIRLGVVDRIEEVRGTAVSLSAGRVRVQLGEHILPLEGLDHLPEPDAKIRLFRLSDGETQLGLAFSEVIDLDAIADHIIASDAPGAVEGVTLVAGEPAELVDAHWLFAGAARAGSGASGEPPVCRLDLADPWVRNMLRPIVEAAGYRVIAAEAEAQADLAIAWAGSAAAPATRHNLFLSPDAEGAANENHVYRYDRAGLLVALREAAKGRA